MITTAILYLVIAFIWLVTLPLRLLPNVVLPSNIADSITTAGNYLHIVNAVVPIPTLVVVIVTAAIIEGAIWIYKLIKWAYTKIPGIN
jgi:hypothetical protein